MKRNIYFLLKRASQQGYLDQIVDAESAIYSEKPRDSIFPRQ